ncbi:phosphoribosylaminoimidazole carboxylase, ATPase subunit [Alkaliphilus metalliredigens QYMF]|uniref:N5-carboxyaminoimidazole ribonucleotide synthase n=1 Tax=Alkaliphilus metalliredigens (strain QYMF) TaxID=293826 RepID=A6TLR8_ALKMQ|nr:5-(carboxyamino)imidazole ribonucleotide synthase [Alkaliphilus metalliredigens]ABR47136.1 phosphoribosylaminoimidazole carboxylase, ATPase subunit [Alkaliphilus metalliredigens QYMF]
MLENDINHIKIGIIGGGQLGKMMILEGQKMGLQFIILDPDSHCPAAPIADEQIVADFYDQEKIEALAESCHILTYEFEHIDADVLISLQEKGYMIEPAPQILKVIQDKYEQKKRLRDNDIPVGDFKKVYSIGDIYEAIEDFQLPILLKSCRGGYDGKGNYLINDLDEVELAYKSLGNGQADLMVEAFVPFEKEISAIVARGINGEIKVFPMAENIHVDNILNTTIFPAQISQRAEDQAKEVAMKTMEMLKGVGVFCVEMFIDKDERVLVNEIAPRTHNSGHFTIEACVTSQFAQQLRCLLGLPLGDVGLLSSGVMVNLLGENKQRGPAKMIGVAEVLKIPGVFLHYYGKTETSPQRKMGHVTILGSSIDEAMEKAVDVRKLLRVVSQDKND